MSQPFSFLRNRCRVVFSKFTTPAAEFAGDVGEDKSPGKTQKNLFKPRSRHTINSLFKKASAHPQGAGSGIRPQSEQSSIGESAGQGPGANEASGDKHSSKSPEPAPDSASPGVRHPLQATDLAKSHSNSEGGILFPQNHSSDEDKMPGKQPHASGAPPNRSEQATTSFLTPQAPFANKTQGKAGRKSSASLPGEACNEDGQHRSAAAKPEADSEGQLRNGVQSGGASGKIPSSEPLGTPPSSAKELSPNGQRGSPGQGNGTVGIGSELSSQKRGNGESGTPAAAQDADDAIFQGIDMAEQKRIMHEIWMRKNMRPTDPGKKQTRKAQAVDSSIAKQPRLTDMYFKRS